MSEQVGQSLTIGLPDRWRQQTFAKNYQVLLAQGVSRAEASRLAALSVQHKEAK